MRSVFLISLFILVFNLQDIAKEAISYGTIELSVTNSSTTGSTSAPSIFLYYGDYLVEKFQTADKNIDSAFCFIDLLQQHCTEYDGMSKSAKEITSYPLANKTYGYLFPPDSVTKPENYLRAVNMPDTTMDFYTYKRFYIISNTKDSVTYYVSPFRIPVPFHLNNIIDRDYKGTLVRIDAAKIGGKSPDITTLRMQIYPNRLMTNELSVFSYWIGKATGKRADR